LLFYRLSVHAVPGHRGSRASVLALWLRPADHAPPPEALLRARWGLSPGEAALSLAVATGERLADIAARSAVSPETVRTQLKNIFAKTGTHRQSDLVRLLHTQFALPLRL
jgi:DNA-binding CsgD family transcriptional regulator